MPTPTFYVYKTLYKNEKFIVYGQAEDFKALLIRHQKEFEASGVLSKLVFTKVCKTKATALSLIATLKRHFPKPETGLPNFVRQCVPQADHKAFALVVKRFKFNKIIPDKCGRCQFPTTVKEVAEMMHITENHVLRVLRQEDFKDDVLHTDEQKARRVFGRLAFLMGDDAADYRYSLDAMMQTLDPEVLRDPSKRKLRVWH